MRMIFTENAASLKNRASCLHGHWPDEELVVISTVPNALNRSVLPRGIPYSEYPLTRPVEYKPVKNWLADGCFTNIIRFVPGEDPVWERVSFDQAATLFRQATALTYLSDWNYTYVWGMDMLQRHFNPGAEPRTHEVIKNSFGYAEEHIANALKSSLDSTDKEYQALLNAAHVRRYFDYNFSLNSLAIFGNLYRAVFGVSEPTYIGKNGLLLLALAAKEGRLAPNHTYEPKNWVGTGKYIGEHLPFFEGLGSSLARQTVIMELEAIGALVSANDETYTLTDKGCEFVSRLHKDCYDIDLPFRLSAWMEKPFDEVKPSMDLYLMTFFRKQKRLQGA